MEIPYYAYVVDEDDKLVGVFPLRDLMLSKLGRFCGIPCMIRTIADVTIRRARKWPAA